MMDLYSCDIKINIQYNLNVVAGSSAVATLDVTRESEDDKAAKILNSQGTQHSH